MGDLKVTIFELVDVSTWETDSFQIMPSKEVASAVAVARVESRKHCARACSVVRSYPVNGCCLDLYNHDDLRIIFST